MYLPPILFPSVIHTLSKFFLLKEKTTFDFPKKKKGSSTCTKIVSPLFVPFFHFDSISRPAKKINLPTTLEWSSQRVLPNLKVARQHPSPLSISKNNCETTGARHDLSSSPLSREKERKKKNPNVGDCTHARSSGETKALVAWLQGNPIDICTVRVTRAVDGGGNKNAAAREKGGTMETQ